MGCGASQPDVAADRMAQSRVDTVGIWDNDFMPKHLQHHTNNGSNGASVKSHNSQPNRDMRIAEINSNSLPPVEIRTTPSNFPASTVSRQNAKPMPAAVRSGGSIPGSFNPHHPFPSATGATQQQQQQQQQQHHRPNAVSRAQHRPLDSDYSTPRSSPPRPHASPPDEVKTPPRDRNGSSRQTRSGMPFSDNHHHRTGTDPLINASALTLDRMRPGSAGQPEHQRQLTASSIPNPQYRPPPQQQQHQQHNAKTSHLMTDRQLPNPHHTSRPHHHPIELHEPPHQQRTATTRPGHPLQDSDHTPLRQGMHPPMPEKSLPQHQKSAHRFPKQTQLQQHVQQNRRFDDHYIRGQDLGKGAFAKVFVGIQKQSKREYAVKHILDRSKMMWSNRDALMDEIASLEKLRNAPHVVQMQEYFMEEKQCFLVMELLPGKELFERIIQKSTFTEAEARNSCRCVLSALAHMHQHRMAHRDLKPENLLLADELDIDKVKLSDFGFAKTLHTQNECKTLCGTPGYLAPEILERWPSYDVKCDVFSFGVILFLLLGGYLPFDSHGSNDIKQVFERTRNGQYHFYPQRWEGISKAAKDLVARCLVVNPSNRISSRKALSHEWMGEGLTLPSRMISSQNLASTYFEVKRHREEQDHRDGTGHDRMKELNDDFTVYLNERPHGESIVSNFTGANKTATDIFTGGASVASFQEDSQTGYPFSHFYTLDAELGQGGFGVVYRCRHMRTGRMLAVKKVDTTRSNKAEKATLKDEITALKYLRGAPYIIRLYDVFEESNISYLVMEEMKGGNLLNRIIDKEVYTEHEARDLCKILFSAVNFCHKKQIAHRDIKPDNLLLQEKDNDASVKLADFGFAKKVKRENGLKTFLGSPNYMAPEIYNLQKSGYDQRCDCWSVGVVVYTLLGGYLPFEGATGKELSVAIMKGEFSFHDEYWRDISPSAKNLINSLLQLDPKNRLTMEAALTSKWMAMDDAELRTVDLSSTKSRIINLVGGKEKVKNAVRMIIGANRLQYAAGLRNSLQISNHESQRESMVMSYPYYMESLAESESELDIEVAFSDVYDLGRRLGEGGFLAKIHSARNKLTKREYSVKIVIRRDLLPADFAALNDEISVLQEVSEGGKTHVVCLYEIYEDPDATFLVMERIDGDVLIDKLVQKKKYTEFDAKELVRNLLQGVNHCHKHSIAIRNLTLDNLLLPQGSECDVIITDFEIAKKVLHPKSLHTQCGTQEFVAPEVLENKPCYDKSCDLWSTGVIAFILLGGYYPFRGKTDAEILKNVRYGNYEFRERLWKGVSWDAQDLLKSMMTVNPDERLTAQEALEHRWINADDLRLSNDLTENVAEIAKDKAAQKFKAAVRTVVATQRLAQNI